MAKDPETWRSRIGLQWHLTNRCNFRCKHCYAEKYAGEEMSLPELKKIFDEYVKLLRKKKCFASINVTGGEPLLRDDFIDLLKYISESRDVITSCNILTNGSLVTPEIVREIEIHAPVVSGFRISIEGSKEINDEIRGEGSFEKILQGVAAVRQNSRRMNVRLSATISKKNYKKIFDLLDILLLFDVSISARRFVPIGGGKKEIDQMLSPQELRDFYKKVDEINSLKIFEDPKRKAIKVDNLCTSGLRYADIPRGRKFEFCKVGQKVSFTIMPNGDVYRCRLFPKVFGNVKKESLEEIYKKIEKFNQTVTFDPVCQRCPVVDKCKGGARCVSAAVCGDPSVRDPQCWQKIK